MKTNQAVTLKFRDYGDITIPCGTPLTHKTACGENVRYHFVDSFDWIDDYYPTVSNILKMDAKNYGINIPAEFVDYETGQGWQPKTGAKCGCRRGVQRDNCSNCEGTGYVIDFKRIRERNKT